MEMVEFKWNDRPFWIEKRIFSIQNWQTYSFNGSRLHRFYLYVLIYACTDEWMNGWMLAYTQSAANHITTQFILSIVKWYKLKWHQTHWKMVIQSEFDWFASNAMWNGSECVESWTFVWCVCFILINTHEGKNEDRSCRRHTEHIKRNP